MKRQILPLCGMLIVALAASAVLGEVPPATAPAVAVQLNPRVEIFPFVSVSQPNQADWIGRGIQESLQSDVSRTGATLLIPGKAPAPTDDVIEIAKQNKADLAVVGTYQIVGDDVRVTGHLIDPATSTTVGGFAATGPQKNLFGIEDALGEQLRRLLPASARAQQTAQPLDLTAPIMQPPPTPAPVVVYEAAPQIYPPSPVVNNYYDNAPYPSSYCYPTTYYGYVNPYPFGFYGGVGIFSGGFAHRDHDRAFESRGFDRGFITRAAPSFRAPVTRGNGIGIRTAPAFGSRSGGFSSGRSIGGRRR